MSKVNPASELLSRSLRTRASGEKFAKDAASLASQYSLPPIYLCDLLLRPKNDSPTAPAQDIRIPDYVVELLKLGKIDASSILRALRKYSKWNVANEEQQSDEPPTPRWQRSYVGEEAILLTVAKAIMNDVCLKDSGEIVRFLTACSEWAVMLSNINLDASVHMNSEVSSKSIEKHSAQLAAVRDAFRTLIEIMAVNEKILKVLPKRCPKSVIRDLCQGLASFTSNTINTAPGIIQQIEVFRTQVLVPLLPAVSKTDTEKATMNSLLDSATADNVNAVSIADLPQISSRAGVYIYLSSLLVARPIIDDVSIITWLHNRYQGDIRLAMTDLILAAFDVLANACFRRESSATILISRSFLVNKVPLLLGNLSSTTFPSTNVEFSITEAMGAVDTNIFPTLSSMFDDSSTSSGNLQTESVRQDFCFACCLQGLIQEESIEKLLGEAPMQTLPASGRYVKEALVNECLDDPGRLERLLSEVELMNGNVGTVCNALVETIQRLCASGNSMPLKSLCSYLARHPSSLDIVLLFEEVVTILKPLCELLDNWRHDDDLGEYQPVYEEFGSILLLVMSLVYRYKLSVSDLSIQSSNSFVAKWLERGTAATRNEDLTETEAGHLSVWVRALFNAEGGGLSDQPMSSCPPQEFYLLVPTLFANIMLASNAGRLSDETMKSGIEFLIDTFLSPSLVGAILWLSNHLWASQASKGAINTTMTILHTLLLPAQISNEASSMLSSVLNIVAKPLERSLRYLQSIEPQRQDIAPLQKALATHLDFYRTGESVHTEIEGWTSTPDGGLATALRQTVQRLVQWSMIPGRNISSGSYTHRQMILSMKMLGAQRLMEVLVDEVVHHTQNGAGSVVLDIVVAVICCPDPATSCSSQTIALQGTAFYRLSLHDALKSLSSSMTKKDNAARTEAIVRLSRRVESQLSSSQTMMQNQANMLGNMSGDGLMTGLAGTNTRIGSLQDVGGMTGMEGMNGLDRIDGMGDMSALDSMMGMDGVSGMGMNANSGMGSLGMEMMGDGTDMLGMGDVNMMLDDALQF